MPTTDGCAHEIPTYWQGVGIRRAPKVVSRARRAGIIELRQRLYLGCDGYATRRRRPFSPLRVVAIGPPEGPHLFDYADVSSPRMLIMLCFSNVTPFAAAG